MPGRFPWSRRRASRKPPAHFVHVGKTAGTAVKFALQPAAHEGEYDLRFHEHEVTLRDIPRGERVFFVVRDPIDRFVSGFYSRRRQGRPRYEYPWSAEESDAFRSFATADSLAIALSESDPRDHAAAIAAMKSIGHVRDSYWRWFDSPEYFTGRLEDVLLILSFHSLTDSFSHLCELLGVSKAITLPSDDVNAHRNPAAIDRGLSAVARQNLQRWYAADVSFLELCAAQPCFAPNLALSASR
ncbi:MAG: sulfotransferase family 2 domain-containing protein [Solirubrobacteraceae bacterium]|jgi:hypothetical protein